MTRLLTCIHCVVLALSLVLGGCNEDGPDSAPSSEVTEITTRSGIVMVLLPAGRFTMGDDDGEDDETPAHDVTLDAFVMDKYEVTQKAYRDLMGTIPPTKMPDDDRPVQQVTWLQAARYCNARSRADALDPCYDETALTCNFDASGYRLPTEAEWEYACRAGTTGEFFFGGDPRELRKFAWFADNSRKATHPVGQVQFNGWGLCDMQGNVSEWCNDYYDEDQYRQRASGSQNPRGPAKRDYRVLRGGNWDSKADTCRSSARHFEAPGFADACFRRDAIGFRCVRRTP